MLSLVLLVWWSQAKTPPEYAYRWPDPDLQLKARLLLFEKRLAGAGKLIVRTREHRWVTMMFLGLFLQASLDGH